MRVSVIINAKNEEGFIQDAINSVDWADEIIVSLSQQSIDKTEEIIRRNKVKVIKQEPNETDFAQWHNQGMNEAKGDWLLWLDADERITPELKEEILKTFKNTIYSAFAIPRRNFLLGKELKSGGWYPDYALRLFLKKDLKMWVGRLHERPVFKGEMGKLKNGMIHLQPDKIEPAFEKSIGWSKIEAKLIYDSNHPPISWWRVFRMGLTTLFERLIKKQGFKDGTEGWIESIYQAFHTMIVYLRVWEMQKK